MSLPQCVVLAGGLGTRMRPFTESCPKAMLPAAGRPFIEHQLEFLVRQGVREVLYLVGYRGDMIRSHLGDGSRWRARVRYVDEGATLRGTAGALKLGLRENALDQVFFLIYGDSFTPVDLGAVWSTFEASGMPALMTILCNEERWDRSNVLFENNRIVVYDKTRRHPRSADMRHIDYGLSVIRREIIQHFVPDDVPADLAPVLNALSLQGLLAGFEATERFYEIGSPSGLSDFGTYIAAGAAC